MKMDPKNDFNAKIMQDHLDKCEERSTLAGDLLVAAGLALFGFMLARTAMYLFA